MRLLPAAAFALLVVTAPLASAPNVLIDFENNWSYGTDVNGYYAGGTASDSTSGPNRGVSFVNFTGLSNDASFTYYSNAPSPLGVAYTHASQGSDHAFHQHDDCRGRCADVLVLEPGRHCGRRACVLRPQRHRQPARLDRPQRQRAHG